jgi:arginyl-tRNA synthetase
LKSLIENLVQQAVATLPSRFAGLEPPALPPTVERTRDTSHGDFATNAALQLAKSARRKPRELAQAIVEALPANELVARVEIAGPGFINFYLAPEAYARELLRVLELGARYGRSTLGAGKRVLVEFVSANPTGPLHVGHGRHAAYGATLANLLDAVGFDVAREYYINDAGRQMEILAASIWLRYLELCGETFAFPANGYRGDYLRPMAERLHSTAGRALARRADEVFAGLPPDAPEGDKDLYIDAVIERARALLGPERYADVFAIGLDDILADIRNDLEEFGVVFDCWFSERSLNENGAIERALERLRNHDVVYLKDGAQWFRATDFGDEKDRVVVRENGIKTYFASDIAYHLSKRERGFELLLDVLGADHHGYVTRVRAGLVAMGEPGDSLEVRLVQFVTLYRGGEKAPMSTRSGEFVTLRELRQDVGNDAARFFYVLRSHEQHLDFDLELAKSQSNDNPVYYIQYAHARVASVMRQLREKGHRYERRDHGRTLAAGRSARDGAAGIDQPLSRSDRAERAAAGAAHARPLPARACERLPHLLQRAHVHRRGCSSAQRATDPDLRPAPGDPERTCAARRLGARDDVAVSPGRTLSRDFKDVRRNTPGSPVPFNGWTGLAIGLAIGLGVRSSCTCTIATRRLSYRCPKPRRHPPPHRLARKTRLRPRMPVPATTSTRCCPSRKSRCPADAGGDQVIVDAAAGRGRAAGRLIQEPGPG